MTSPVAASRIPADRPRTSIGDIVWVAVSAAVVAACVHVAQVEFRYRVVREFTWTSREFAWLALGGYLMQFLAAALPVILLVMLLRRRVGLRLAATLLVTLAAFAMLLLCQKMPPASQLVLALGIGSVIGARIADRPQRARR